HRTDDGVNTDVRDAVSAVDAGWLAGAGVELDTGTRARLSNELRYEHGLRELVPGSPGDAQQSLSGLVGIVYGGAPPLRAGHADVDDEPSPRGGATLDGIEARVTRLVTAMEASPAAPRGRRGTLTCGSGAARPAAS